MLLHSRNFLKIVRKLLPLRTEPSQRRSKCFVSPPHTYCTSKGAWAFLPLLTQLSQRQHKVLTFTHATIPRMFQVFMFTATHILHIKENINVRDTLSRQARDIKVTQSKRIYSTHLPFQSSSSAILLNKPIRQAVH